MKDAYYEIFLSNACDVFDTIKNEFILEKDLNCEEFKSGQMIYGFNYVLSDYIDILSSNIRKIEYYTENPEAKWKGNYFCPSYPNLSNMQNNLICLSLSEQVADMSKNTI